MEQIIIEVNNKSMLRLLIELFSTMKGVKIKSISGEKLGSIDKSLMEVTEGKVFVAKNAKDLIEKCLR